MSANNPIILNMNFDTIKETVLTNLVKMVGYRQWIKKSHIDKIIGEVTSVDNDNMIYSIKLDVDLRTFEVYDFTIDLAIEAGRLRYEHKSLKSADSIHLATALANNVTQFITNDEHLVKLKLGIEIVPLTQFQQL